MMFNQNIENEILNNTPFIENLKENEFQPENKTIRQIEGDGEVVVRKDLHLYYDQKRGDMDLKERLEYYKKAKIKIEELRDKFDIDIPPFSFVVGKGENTKEGDTIYTVTKKVHGQLLKDVEVDDVFVNKLKNLTKSLIRSLQYAHEIGDDYLFDIYTMRQYKYGKLEGEDENNIYLVDFEPWMRGVEDFNNPHLYYDILDLKGFVEDATLLLNTDMKEIYDMYNDFLIKINKFESRFIL